MQKKASRKKSNPFECPMRIGLGYDIHRLVKNRPLIIGGVEIPAEKGCLGHSDGDPLTHAIMDALLGAMGERDIGVHFPDNDPLYRGISSLELLKKVVKLLSRHDYSIVNIDSILVIEKPKISPYIPAIKENLARTMKIEQSNIAIKVTSNEKVDSAGRNQSAFAHAAVLLIKNLEKIKRKDETR